MVGTLLLLFNSFVIMTYSEAVGTYFYDGNKSEMYLRCFLHQAKSVLLFNGKILREISTFLLICRRLILSAGNYS